MDIDPDIALPTIEAGAKLKGHTDNETTPRSRRGETGSSSDVNTPRRGTNNHIFNCSPTRSSLKTSRARSTTPSSSSISRSASVASLRNDQSATPKLDKKRSVPNLSVRSSTPAHQPQFRRASSNLNPATPTRMKSSERPQRTSASVAKDYFQEELQRQVTVPSQVAVFAHDACYGHRFSRPRASKAMLGSIVERPERIHAALLGASTAYVRLGDRHKEGRYAPHPGRVHSSLPFHFVKTSRSVPLNHPAVTTVHGTKWMESLQVMCDSAEAKLAIGQKELSRPVGHTRDSKGNPLPALHSGDLYLSSESLAAMQGCLGGVCEAIDTVCQQDSQTTRAFVCIRPPGHHCSADFPSGFCWLNNVHVGVTYAAMNHQVTHAAIIDFDLHHGDGSQTIAWDHNRNAQSQQHTKATPPHKKIPIGYYSLHDINSYPCEYGDEDKIRNASTCLHTAHGQSIWNVHLEPWESHNHFWTLYETKYKILLEKAQSFLVHHSEILRRSGVQPKAAIFLSSGFDASEWEGSGMQRHQVNVPTEFYAKFTADIVRMSQLPETAVNGRVVSVLEGGYSDRALTSGVLSHLCGLTCLTSEHEPETPLSSLTKMMKDTKLSDAPTYETSWWHESQLEQLEAMVAGHLPPPPKIMADKSSNSYSSPTHASTARMTDIAKERRSINAQIEARMAFENAPPEPIPEVDWVTAAYELSRLLIPTDRQTTSCTHEELNAENSKVRRDRLSTVGLPTTETADAKMQLRDRRSRQPAPTSAVTQPRVSSRNTNRRTTIAAASELPDASAREPTKMRRRSSAASSVMSSVHDMKLDNGQDSVDLPESSRSGSAVPSGLDTAFAVKKTRNVIKKQPSTSTSPRKVKNTTSAKGRLSTVGEVSKVEPPPDAHPPASNTDGLDELTSGMKKISIKLKMPTQDQHEANQKRGGEPAAKPRPVRKPPVPKFNKGKPTQSTEPPQETWKEEPDISSSNPVTSGSVVPQPNVVAKQEQNDNDEAILRPVRTMSAIDFLSSNGRPPQPSDSRHDPRSSPKEPYLSGGSTASGEVITYPLLPHDLPSLSPQKTAVQDQVRNV